jgi:DNA processing protein
MRNCKGNIPNKRQKGFPENLPDYELNFQDDGELPSERKNDVSYDDTELFQLIRAGEESYPERLAAALGETAPSVLTCYGDIRLLNTRRVMVCGARNASQSGTDIAYRCGRVIAECGFTVLSGYARGVDMAAHRGALEAGGKTIAFLPFGLSKFRVHRDIQESFDPNCFLAVSELPLWQVFTTPFAFRRNKLMVALADAVIVVEPGETGGTWYSAEKAWKMGKGLYFLEGARPEIIPRLESLGGRRIEVRNGVPDLKEILEGLYDKDEG